MKSAGFNVPCKNKGASLSASLRFFLFAISLFAVSLPLSAQTELGVKDDLTVLGTNGTALDPNTEIKGFTVFGATQAAYAGAVVGPGNVVVNGALAVSSGAYFTEVSTFSAGMYVMAAASFTDVSNIYITGGADNQVLAKNGASGPLKWTSTSALGDNLGNHTATQALNMANFSVNSAAGLTLSNAGAAYNVNFSSRGLVLFNSAVNLIPAQTIVGGLGFIGPTVEHAQFHYRLGKGFEMLNVSGDNPSIDHLSTVFAPLYLSNLYTTGNVGLSTGAPQARLDVLSAGSAPADMAQIWRNGGGSIVSSMSATGVMQAVKFIGDGSGLSGVLTAGDNLGNHTATQNLNMNTFNVTGAGTVSLGNGGTGDLLTINTANSGGTNGGLLIQSASAGSAYFRYDRSGSWPGKTYIGNNASVSGNAPTTAITIDGTSGVNKVGIGTTSPATSLQVNTPGLALDGIGVVSSDGHTLGIRPSLGAGSYNPLVQNGDMAITYSSNTQGAAALVIAPWAAASSGIRMDGAGNVGIGVINAGARLDAQAAGSTAVDMAQIWRNGGGSIVSSMSATGVMQAVKFIGDGSGLTNLTANIAASAGILNTKDLRTIAPSAEAGGTMRFGFTSFANNSSAPYGDYLHLRSYTDATGGNDNLVMFRKDTIGMRIWQQAWGSATAYSAYKDMAFTDGTNATGSWPISITGTSASAAPTGAAGGVLSGSYPTPAFALNTSYPVAALAGNGLKFWDGSDSYKIAMGNTVEYHYGPVTDFSIKNFIDSNSNTRGFTWGQNGVAPVAALNVGNGNFQTAGSMNNGGILYQNTSAGQGAGAHGISWYSPAYYAWFDYMAPPGATNSPSGTAAPSDAASGVTTWARRFNTENVAGYGWLFESGPNTSGTAPTVKFAINANNGNFHATGAGTVDGALTVSGSIGAGTSPSARLHIHEPTALGAVAGNSQILSRVSGATSNTFMNNLWLYRKTAGADWTTARLHDAISVDASFLTPGTDTRVWWERDPSNNIQSWGNAANTYMTINNGSVGVGTTVPDAGLTVQGSLEERDSGDAFRMYKNLASYNVSSPNSAGTIKISLPSSKVWSNTMLRVVIKGYDYSGSGAWEVIVGGYNYNSPGGWINTSAEIRGSAPFSTVRLAHDGTANVILLGTLANSLQYPKIRVDEVLAGHSNYTGWGSGWLISQITNEGAITNIVTPVLITYALANGLNATGTWPISISGTSAGAAPSGAAGGALNGTYPNPGIASLPAISGAALTNLTAANISNGTAGINITGSAGSATIVNAPDGDRNAATKLPTTTGHGVRFDFVNAASANGGGNYAGLMTYAPWDGTTASTGDSSYQLAFNSTLANGAGLPYLSLRKGIDSTWNAWYTLLHSGNYNSYAPSLTGTGASGTWNISITGTSAGAAPTGTAGGNLSGTYPNPAIASLPAISGAALTNLTAANISAGTAGINVTGNAATATKLSSQGNYAETAPGTTRGPAGLNMFEVYANGYPATYGNLLHLAGGGGGQLLIGWSGVDGANADNYIRSKRDNDVGAWSPWAKILTDANYNSYAPTLTGIGASGSWNINVNGSAGSATNATNATNANFINGTYTGSGGLQPPSYIPNGQVRFNMMTGVPGTAGGYQDWLMMDTYTGADVPYVTMLGVSKTAGAPVGYIAVGAKGGSTWAATPLITGSNIGSQTTANVTSLAGTWDGMNYFRSNKGAASTVGANSSYALMAYSSDAGAAGMSFHRGGYYAVNMGLDPDNVLRIGGWSAPANLFQLDMAGNLTLAGTVAAPTFAGALSGNAATATTANGNFTNDRADAGAFGGYSGFYQTSMPAPAADWPSGATGWWHLLDVRHSNLTNNYAMQMAGSFYDQNFWVRKTAGAATTAWSQLITSGNIGSQSVNYANTAGGAPPTGAAGGALSGSYPNPGLANNASYPVSAADGNGLKFWNGSDSYKISMGNAAEYHYGPVTDYSIKTSIDATVGRGFVWGNTGATPAAALSNTGNFQVAGAVTTSQLNSSSVNGSAGNVLNLYAGNSGSAMNFTAGGWTAMQIPPFQGNINITHGLTVGQGNTTISGYGAISSTQWITSSGGLQAPNVTVQNYLTISPVTLTLVNGNNNDVVVTGTVNVISGPTGVFYISGLSLNGYMRILYNPTPYAMCLYNDSVLSTAGNRIFTNTGGTVCTTGQGVFTLFYDTAGQHWFLAGSQL